MNTNVEHQMNPDRTLNMFYVINQIIEKLSILSKQVKNIYDKN